MGDRGGIDEGLIRVWVYLKSTRFGAEDDPQEEQQKPRPENCEKIISNRTFPLHSNILP